MTLRRTIHPDGHWHVRRNGETIDHGHAPTPRLAAQQSRQAIRKHSDAIAQQIRKDQKQ
jgi:hypothetical protein